MKIGIKIGGKEIFGSSIEAIKEKAQQELELHDKACKELAKKLSLEKKERTLCMLALKKLNSETAQSQQAHSYEGRQEQ